MKKKRRRNKNMEYIVIEKWVDNSYNESYYHKVFSDYKKARHYVSEEMKATEKWAIEEEGYETEDIQKFIDEKCKKYCIWEEKFEHHFIIQKLVEE